jgi:hypothetical protein
MTAYKKNSFGQYVINGKTYEMLIGSRAQVMHGTAYKTNGGLTKKDLFRNKSGRFVSLKLHKRAKRENRLGKAGYRTKKGKFGSFKVGTTTGTKKRRGRGKRGGQIVL